VASWHRSGTDDKRLRPLFSRPYRYDLSGLPRETKKSPALPLHFAAVLSDAPAPSRCLSPANEINSPAEQTEAAMTQRKKKFDLYQTVTDQIIEAIETSQSQGFQLPWHRAGASIFLPTNATTDKAYRGINILSLWASAETNQFTTGQWATYK
jgi:hypothetical protein